MFAYHYLASMARVLTCFARQISSVSGIHMEGFFPVYGGKVLPRGKYPLGWVFLYGGNTYLGRFIPLAIPTQVQVPETNSIVSKHKVIKNGEDYIALEICMVLTFLYKIKVTSSVPSDYVGRSGKGMTTDITLRTINMPKSE